MAQGLDFASRDALGIVADFQWKKLRYIYLGDRSMREPPEVRTGFRIEDKNGLGAAGNLAGPGSMHR